jgi:hypothetical protein
MISQLNTRLESTQEKLINPRTKLSVKNELRSKEEVLLGQMEDVRKDIRDIQHRMDELKGNSFQEIKQASKLQSGQGKLNGLWNATHRYGGNDSYGKINAICQYQWH